MRGYCDQFPKSYRHVELDGLRALSVIFVVIHHLYGFSGTLPHGSGIFSYVVNYLGKCGVNVFFIISGFVITLLLLREKTLNGAVSLKAFYVRRIFRILPTYSIYLASLLVLSALGLISVSNNDLFWSALFLGDTTLIHDWFVFHTWSLSVEEQFYLTFPPLLCYLCKWRPKVILVILCGLYVSCLLSLKIAHEFSNRISINWINVASLFHFRYIIIGCLLGLCPSAALRHLADKSRIAPICVALFVVFIPLWEAPDRIIAFLINAIEPCLLGLFVMWFVQNPSRCQFLRWRSVQWVGAASYSIYLWQQLFLGPPYLYIGWSQLGFPMNCVAIILCSTFTYYLVERPCIRIGRFLAGRFQKSTSECLVPDAKAPATEESV